MSCQIIYNNQKYSIESFKDFLDNNKSIFLQDFISQDIEGFKKFKNINTEVNNSKVEVVNNSFNNLSEYTNEEKSKILTTFASKYNISEQKALEDINKSLKADKQGTIDKLNECF